MPIKSSIALSVSDNLRLISLWWLEAWDNSAVTRSFIFPSVLGFIKPSNSGSQITHELMLCDCFFNSCCRLLINPICSVEFKCRPTLFLKINCLHTVFLTCRLQFTFDGRGWRRHLATGSAWQRQFWARVSVLCHFETWIVC